jgi:hypothetical protein
MFLPLPYFFVPAAALPPAVSRKHTINTGFAYIIYCVYRIYNYTGEQKDKGAP